MLTTDSSAPSLLSHDSPLRLLLIEDSASDSDLVLAMLEQELPRARVTVAADLEQALLRLAEEPYDATLADLSLPDAEGLAVVHAVRTAFPETALLVLTGRADGTLALWALAGGAQDYLVKGQDSGKRLATALLHALQRQRTEQEARRYLELARGLLDAIEAPTCAVTAKGDIVAVNQAWRAFLTSNGGREQDCGEGSSYLQTCQRVPSGTPDGFDAADVADGLQAVLGGHLERYEHEYPCHGNEGERWFSVRISPADIEGGRGAVITHVDITAMQVVQRALSHQALHDALTGLPNRVLLADRLSQALTDCDRRGLEVGVGFLDLDHFKRVNDSFGHPLGDALLVQVAERLSKQLRAGDTLARYSGDEFVAIWRDLTSADEVTALSHRLAQALRDPFDLGGVAVSVSASVGVVVGGGSQTVEELLLAADAAMYDAKRLGRARIRVFSNELRRDARERVATEVDLRVALTRSELFLRYQPVIDLDSGRPVAVEALVRWNHPERGLLGPELFIPVAEAGGLIEPLGRWVLDRACRDAASLTGPSALLDVAVNLSARELAQPDLLQHVREALGNSGLDPQRLILGVTESAVMEDEQAAAIALEELTRLGVRIAVDDFGTGYSSLLYLRRYPISALKLDRAFVSGISVSVDDEAICRSVISLARAVGATSIAEGVESSEQYATLKAFGCQQAQGFLWSPAVAIEDLSGALISCRQVPLPDAPAPRRRPRRNDRLDPDVAARIAVLLRAGASLHTIAAVLNRDGMLTPTGVRWTANAVARHLST